MRATILALGAAALGGAPASAAAAASNPKTCQPPPMPHGIINPIALRYNFATLCNELGLLGKAVELGTHSGEFAFAFRSQWKGELFYAVDPWEHQPDDAYVDVANVGQEAQNERLLLTASRLAPFSNSAVLLREYSTDAVRRFENNSVSFVYIDANHAYDAVARDIADWWPKVEPGGILAGHDYVPDALYNFGEFGVQRAVMEFAQPRCLPVHVTYFGQPGAMFSSPADAAFPSWYIFKPYEEVPEPAPAAAAPAAEPEPAAAVQQPAAPAAAVTLGDPEDEDLGAGDFIKPQDL